jgi:ribosome biogenesis GTPase
VTAEQLAATVRAAFGRETLVLADDGRLLRAAPRGRRMQPVCGDRVSLSDISGERAVIDSIAPRRTEFARASEHRVKVIAANLTQVVILVACEPSFDDELLCRLLVAARRAQLGAVLVLNKIDLGQACDAARRALEPFRGLGYPIVELAGKLDPGPLRPHLAGQRSLLVGQSGMGKSTLLKALVPDAEVRIAEISRHLDAGRQSTTACRLYALDDGSEIVDSPGIAEFGLAGIGARELAEGFPEIALHAAQCKFRDCRHFAEPGCAVRSAADEGRVHPRRLALYQRIAKLERCA